MKRDSVEPRDLYICQTIWILLKTWIKQSPKSVSLNLSGKYNQKFF